MRISSVDTLNLAHLEKARVTSIHHGGARNVSFRRGKHRKIISRLNTTKTDDCKVFCDNEIMQRCMGRINMMGKPRLERDSEMNHSKSVSRLGARNYS